MFVDILSRRRRNAAIWLVDEISFCPLPYFRYKNILEICRAKFWNSGGESCRIPEGNLLPICGHRTMYKIIPEVFLKFIKFTFTWCLSDSGLNIPCPLPLGCSAHLKPFQTLYDMPIIIAPDLPSPSHSDMKFLSYDVTLHSNNPRKWRDGGL